MFYYLVCRPLSSYDKVLSLMSCTFYFQYNFTVRSLPFKLKKSSFCWNCDWKNLRAGLKNYALLKCVTSDSFYLSFSGDFSCCCQTKRHRLLSVSFKYIQKIICLHSNIKCSLHINGLMLLIDPLMHFLCCLEMSLFLLIIRKQIGEKNVFSQHKFMFFFYMMSFLSYITKVDQK